jgi:ferredoxin
VALVKIHVDPAKCQGHNRCYQLEPKLFQLDKYGYSSERDGGVVPPDLEDKARLAVENCPERAISITDE